MLFELYLEKKSKVALNPGKTKEKLGQIADEARKNPSLSFQAEMSKASQEPYFDDETGEEGYLYRAMLTLRTHAKVQEVAERRFAVVLKNLHRAAAEADWVILPEVQRKNETLADLAVSKSGPDNNVPPRPLFKVPDLTPEAMRQLSAGIYEREAHIRVIHSSVVTFARSLQKNQLDPTIPVHRSHVLLKGKPASAKTSLLESFRYWLNASDTHGLERVASIDAPTLSKAGLENHLLNLAEKNQLGEILILEEIEKCALDSLLALLSVMQSGVVSRLNARIGNRRAVANMVIWATVNDEKILKEFRRGALHSRFTHKLHCSRPSRELMFHICSDRARLLGGTREWAEKAIEFAYETMPRVTGFPMDDPREVLGLLDGGDALLTGEYQDDLLSIVRKEYEEKSADEEREGSTLLDKYEPLPRLPTMQVEEV